MTDLRYKNFDLQIRTAQQGYAAAVLHSPAGEAETDFHIPFTVTELQSLFWLVGRDFQRVRIQSDSTIEPAEALEPQHFGERLYRALFGNELGPLLIASLRLAEQEGFRLRIRLHFTKDVPELADLPWEYLYAPGLRRFVALSNQTVLVRYMSVPRPQQALQVRPPLTILCMIAEPANLPQLAVEEEWHRLQQALSTLRASKLIYLERLETAGHGGTMAALQQRLRRGRSHPALHWPRLL
ncbi:MAG: hypothetical protein R2932_03590 [Caldilineaceae bacterium]